MSKVLQRTMFRNQASKAMFSTANGHDHRGTGIASGLEYRPGYKVGGMVKPKRGLVNEPGGYAGSDDLKDEIQYLDPLLQQTISTDVDNFKPIPFLPINPRLFTGIKGPLRLRGEPKTSFVMSRSGDVIPTSRALVPTSAAGVPAVPTTGINPALFGWNLQGAKVAGGLTGGGLGALGIAEAMSADPIISDDDEEEEKSETLPQTLEEQVTAARKKRNIQKLIADAEKPKVNGDPDDKKTLKDKTEAAIEAVFTADKYASDLIKERDAELAQLRQKQAKDFKLLAAANIVSAMNDPNLRKGQSRVAAGTRQLVNEATEFQKIKNQQAETDLAIKYARDEKSIDRKYAMEDYKAKKEIDQLYPVVGAQVTYLHELLKLAGVEQGSPEAEDFIKEFIFGKKGQYGQLASKVIEAASDIAQDPENFRSIYNIPQRYDEDDEPAILDNTDIEKALEYLAENVIQAKDGGRIGYREGELVQPASVETNPETKEAPMVMTYNQLRAKLPEFITDNIVKLISYSPEAFKDFANISTQADVDEFNAKYDVNLVLPEPDSMETQVTAMPPMGSTVTVPSAVAADPNIMPMQSGTGQLTPTETALLDSTEQAIRMRNR